MDLADCLRSLTRLQHSVALSLGVGTAQVTFAASDDVCTGADAGEQRRLQAGTLAYTVTPDPALLPALLDKTRDGSWLDEVIVDGVVVEEDAPATEGTVIISCDEFKAFPPGVPRTSRAVCECIPGRTKLGSECVPCSPGLWKQIIGDGQCINCALVGGTTASVGGAVECSCTENHALQPGSQLCDRCPKDGVYCPGGFKMPYALEGHYMVNRSFAAPLKCIVKGSTGESVCLGGKTCEAMGDCLGECVDGHTGFLCGACDDLYSRDNFPGACEPCPATLAWSFAVMAVGWIYDSCLYIFFAVMAATAATKDRPSIQTVLLRILMSWVAAVSVLSQFSLPSVQLFSWSTDETDSMGSDVPAKPSLFEFPLELEAAYQQAYSALNILTPKVSSPHVTLECWASRFWPYESDRDVYLHEAKLIVPAIYWTCLHIPFELGMTLVVSLVIIYLLSRLAMLENSIA